MKKQTTKKSALRKWVDSVGGKKKAAARLNVSLRSVDLWLSRSVTPRAATLNKIHKLAGGRYSFVDLLASTIK